MKGTHLGELEEIALLIVASLFDNAYGVAIKAEIEQQANRKITISSVHNVLQRLQEKGFLESRFSEPTKERGGKRKLLFRVTTEGQNALENSKSLRQKLWDNIPNVAFNR
ncbi:MAG: PadR family transcriptional regulator [bacterium]|nr:PadR family transcriptional regulator [bacterium]